MTNRKAHLSLVLLAAAVASCGLPDPTNPNLVYVGSFDVSETVVNTTRDPATADVQCTYTMDYKGTASFSTIAVQGDSIKGNLQITGTAKQIGAPQRVVLKGASTDVCPTLDDIPAGWTRQLVGSYASISGTETFQANSTLNTTTTWQFSGSIANEILTGTAKMDMSGSGTTATGTAESTASITLPLSLSGKGS